jgi:hypothetical protein
MTLKDIKAPYYRIFMNPVISKLDNLIESLFYNRIAVMANVHGVLISSSLIQTMTDNFNNPQGSFGKIYGRLGGH